MHAVVVAQALNVGHVGVVAGFVEGEFLGQTWCLHLVADEGTSGGLVGLVAVCVAGFTDCQDSGVGGFLVLGFLELHVGLGLGGHVHGDGRWGRLEGAQTADVFLDGHAGVSTIEHLELAVGIAEAAVHLAEWVFGLGHAVGGGLQRLGCVGEGKDDILGFILEHTLREDGIEGFGGRGWGDRSGYGDGAVDGEK